MRDTFSITVETPSGLEVPIAVTADLYEGTNRPDDPSECDILYAFVEENVSVGGVVFFEVGQVFPWELYWRTIEEKVWRRIK